MISINGQNFKGQNIQISNNKIYIDGKRVDKQFEDDKVFNIEVEGPLSKLDVDNAESIIVNGDCGNAKSTNGNIKITGDIAGDVKTTNGNVSANVINGKVTTTNGNISH